MGSIFTSQNVMQGKMTKHIDIYYHYIQEMVQKNNVKLYFVEGAKNLLTYLPRIWAILNSLNVEIY